MVNWGTDEIKKNPYFKAKDKNDDKVKKEKIKSVQLAKDLVAEKKNDEIILSKVSKNGEKEVIQKMSADSKMGSKLNQLIDKNNKSKEDTMKEKIDDMMEKSRRLSLANYL
jgi:hypothetical protein